ncbi:MAG: hypothetical protein SCALA702_21440 [Melioribacteraceae bacterium]|nr:MAG: hypothetical protein SCALA702_21440 [Melioribacteraceae bacterium]
MNYTVYILKSELNGRHYVGHTGDIDARLKAHNSGKVRSTKAYRTWKIIYKEEYPDKQSAYKREMEIKGYKGGESFKLLIDLQA